MDEGDSAGPSTLNQRPLSTTENGATIPSMNGVTRLYAFDGHNDQSQSSASLLPARVIEEVLRHSDPQTFLALSQLNRHWFSISDNRSLYLYQLARCPSYTSDDTDTFKPLLNEDLTNLKRALHKEIPKVQEVLQDNTPPAQDPESRPDTGNRLKFDHTVWKLVAPSTTSSTIAPHGESFSFYTSSNGQYLVATSSSRIFVLNITGNTPSVNRELKVRRRPALCIISDDGEALIVLSSGWRIDSYRLKSEQPVQRRKLIYLEGPTSALAVSPDGTLLVAAHDNSLEFVSLADDMPSSRRRKIACETAHHLSFSKSGMSLLGTSTDVRNSSTTIVNAPEETSMDGMGEFMETQRQDQIWLAQLLFPSTFQDCSFAAFLPESDLGHITTLFGFDAPAECFGLLDMTKLQFKGPTVELPQRGSGETIRVWSLPRVTSSGDQVAVGCPGSIQLYDIPAATELEHDNSTLPRHDITVNEDVSSVSWVAPPPGLSVSSSRRLLGVLPTKRAEDSLIENTFDSGRLVVLDFHPDTLSRPVEDKIFELIGSTLEDLDQVAPDQRENELAEEGFKLAQRAASIKPRLALGRSVTSARNSTRPRRRQDASTSATADTNSGQQEYRQHVLMPAVDEPYSHSQPRSAETLQRAATLAAGSQRYRNAPNGALVFRRADRSEIPDESDADNWVPPPPPYQKSPDDELPEHLRRTLQPRSTPDLIREGLFDTITDDQLLQTPSPQANEEIPQRSASIRRSFTDPLCNQSFLAETTMEHEAAPAPTGPSRPQTHIIERPIILSQSESTSESSSPVFRPRNRHSLQPATMRHANDASRYSRRPASVSLSGNVADRQSSSASSTGHHRHNVQQALISPPILPPEPPQILPSAAQIASLNRRHTISEDDFLYTNSEVAPRAAAGARRSMTVASGHYVPVPLNMSPTQQARQTEEDVSPSSHLSPSSPLPPLQAQVPPSPSPTQEQFASAHPEGTERDSFQVSERETDQDVIQISQQDAAMQPQAQYHVSESQSLTMQGLPPQQQPQPEPQMVISQAQLVQPRPYIAPQQTALAEGQPAIVAPQTQPPHTQEIPPWADIPSSQSHLASSQDRSFPHQGQYLDTSLPTSATQTNSGQPAQTRLNVGNITPDDANQSQTTTGFKRLSTMRSMSSLLGISHNQSRTPSRQQEANPDPTYGQPSIASHYLDRDESLRPGSEQTRRTSVLFGAKAPRITRVDGYTEKSVKGAGRLKKEKRKATKCVIM